ncbi:lactonase family protein [Neolewinella antarctica]|uniref:6-phosphogluconolactonase n=1 Tax=Neolewinella antarctica TaxID=442734 RepID=A0ABX0X6D0_9BACT|nr:lactonase family protein [Neolewinella antarctica]NJC24635.1 6-phosphogluconolactonase [Neolewinella antarctica]
MKAIFPSSSPVRLFSLLFPLLLLLFAGDRCTPPLRPSGASTDEQSVYVGTYTRKEGHVDGKAAGIYRAVFNTETGAIKPYELVADITNPSYLKYDATTRRLYAVSELRREGEPTGYLHVLDERRGELREVAKLPTDGQAPCHIAHSGPSQFIVVTNYVGGVAKLYQNTADGVVAVDKFTVPESAKNGRASWLHSSQFSPDTKILAIADKGLSKVWLFTLDVANRKLVPHPQVAVDLAEGAGSRHLVWSRDGGRLYVINELDNTINLLTYDRPQDRFSVDQTISTLPSGVTERSITADIHLHPNGRFLYGSNRGHNSIAVYAVVEGTGELTSLGFEPTRGAYPRNFTVAPNGKFLFVANQNTSNVTSYGIDPDSGKLTFTGLDYSIPTPVCLEFTE